MAKTLVYTCDICKQKKNENDLAKLTVKCYGLTMNPAIGLNEQLQIDICSDCLREKGFIVEAPKTQEQLRTAELTNAASLEDKIYDFLSAMGVVFQE